MPDGIASLHGDYDGDAPMCRCDAVDCEGGSEFFAHGQASKSSKTLGVGVLAGIIVGAVVSSMLALGAAAWSCWWCRQSVDTLKNERALRPPVSGNA